MKLTLLILVLFLPIGTGNIHAQDYRVQWKTLKVKLFKGYGNKFPVNIQHPKDTINQYRFHAIATGADIDYDETGKVNVLPNQRSGNIKVYAESKGKFYFAGAFDFESVVATPDAIEIEKLKPSIDKKIKFKIGNKSIINSADVEMDGFPMNDLSAGELNLVKIRIVIPQNGQYITPYGKIEITSTDATIKKVDVNTFQVTTLPGKRQCIFSVYLNNQKILDDKLRVANYK